jgi:hypothetical protein
MAGAATWKGLRSWPAADAPEEEEEEEVPGLRAMEARWWRSSGKLGSEVKLIPRKKRRE